MSPETAASTPSRAPARPAIPDVLAEHLEEHAFLSLQRRKLIVSVEFPLRRLPQHDARIDAHWDGLVIGGEGSVKLALERLEGDDPWQVASALRVWLEIGRAAPEAIAAKLAAAPPELDASWREALRGAPAEIVTAALPARAAGAWPAPALGVALDALAWHEALPESLAAGAARHADPAVRAALARALPHAGLGEPLAPLRALLADAEPAVARRALWGVALLDPEAALAHARRLARGATPEPFAVRVLGLLGGPDDHAAIEHAAATDSARRAAFWALADLGSPDAIESLIGLLALADDELRALAGEALEYALGTVPRPKPDKPPTPEQARARWTALAGSLPRDARVLAGAAVPWNGEARDEPMYWLWRSAIAGRGAQAPWLAREVPDGFFDALPVADARPGE